MPTELPSERGCEQCAMCEKERTPKNLEKRHFAQTHGAQEGRMRDFGKKSLEISES